MRRQKNTHYDIVRYLRVYFNVWKGNEFATFNNNYERI